VSRTPATTGAQERVVAEMSIQVALPKSKIEPVNGGI
jgi:hypothetical protein